MLRRRKKKLKKSAVLPDCFVLLNYYMVEKKKKTKAFLSYKKNTQSAAVDSIELLQVPVVPKNLRQKGKATSNSQKIQ